MLHHDDLYLFVLICGLYLILQIYWTNGGHLRH
jgi:hypothetical protein